MKLTNLAQEPLAIGMGTSTYAFEVGMPIGVLYFQPTSESFRAKQDLGRGVREGSFRLVMERGVPKVSGSMKVGKVR